VKRYRNTLNLIVNRIVQAGIAACLLLLVASCAVESKTDKKRDNSPPREVSLKTIWNAVNSDNPVHADREYGKQRLKITGCHVLDISRGDNGFYKLAVRCEGSYRNTRAATIFIHSDVLATAKVNTLDMITVVGVPVATREIETRSDRYTSIEIEEVESVTFERHMEFD
jgi:hypothetical protein